jgi:hypothetical protein
VENPLVEELVEEWNVWLPEAVVEAEVPGCKKLLVKVKVSKWKG